MCGRRVEGPDLGFGAVVPGSKLLEAQFERFIGLCIAEFAFAGLVLPEQFVDEAVGFVVLSGDRGGARSVPGGRLLPWGTPGCGWDEAGQQETCYPQSDGSGTCRPFRASTFRIIAALVFDHVRMIHKVTARRKPCFSEVGEDSA